MLWQSEAGEPKSLLNDGKTKKGSEVCVVGFYAIIIEAVIEIYASLTTEKFLCLLACASYLCLLRGHFLTF